MSKSTVTILSIIHILFAISLLIWLVFFGFIFMLFDAPGSQDNPLNYVLLFSVLTYPIPVLVGTLRFWKNVRQKPTDKLYSYTATLFISPISIVIAFWLLELFCGGKTTC